MKNIQLLDSVAILKPGSLERLTLVESEYGLISNLPAGQVGTVVEVYHNGEEYQYLVEFADNQSCEYAMAILKEDEVLALHYEITTIF